jgi:hypothetical protein
VSVCAEPVYRTTGDRLLDLVEFNRRQSCLSRRQSNVEDSSELKVARIINPPSDNVVPLAR